MRTAIVCNSGASLRRYEGSSAVGLPEKFRLGLRAAHVASLPVGLGSLWKISRTNFTKCSAKSLSVECAEGGNLYSRLTLFAATR